MPHSTSYILHSTLKCKFYILHFTFYILLAFAMMSCTKSTSPKTGSLSGRVILVNDTDDPSLDPVDFSGVTVALYELAVLDTTIVRINQEYPQIGVQISQETEFDHRLQYPVKVVTSNTEGDFQFDQVPYGEYNVALYKQGWGFRYLYTQSITEGQNTLMLSRGLTIPELYPERRIAGAIDTGFTFLSDRLYIAEDDVNILPTAHVIVEPYSTLCIAPGKKFYSYGLMDTSTLDDSEYFKVIAMQTEGIHYGDKRFGSIEILCTNEIDNCDVSNIIVKGSIEGIRVNGTISLIKNCIIESSQSSLSVNAVDNINLEKILIRSDPDSSEHVVNITNSENVYVYGLIVLNVEQGVLVQNSSYVSIERSMFHKIGVGILNQLDGESLISFNTFEDNGVAVRNANRASCVITNNTISAVNAIRNEKTLPTHTADGWTEFIAEGNNFYCTSYAVVNKMSFTGYDLYELNAKNNYWGTSSQLEIAELIYDHYSHTQSNGIVQYLPFRSNHNHNSGINGK